MTEQKQKGVRPSDNCICFTDQIGCPTFSRGFKVQPRQSESGILKMIYNFPRQNPTVVVGEATERQQLTNNRGILQPIVDFIETNILKPTPLLTSSILSRFVK